MKDNESQAKRIVLESNPALKVISALEELRSAHCRVTASQLVSAIVEHYFQTQYQAEKERTRLEKLFFSQRSYLKSILQKSSSEEEILESLKACSERLNGALERRTKKTGVKKTPNSSAECEQNSSETSVS